MLKKCPMCGEEYMHGDGLHRHWRENGDPPPWWLRGAPAPEPSDAIADPDPEC